MRALLQPSHSSSGHLNDDDEEGFDADNLVNSVQGEILGQVLMFAAALFELFFFFLKSSSLFFFFNVPPRTEIKDLPL
jgi:hypothetical protein